MSNCEIVCSDSLTNDQCNLLKKNDNQFCSGNGKEICAKTCEDCSGKNDIMKSKCYLICECFIQQTKNTTRILFYYDVKGIAFGMIGRRGVTVQKHVETAFKFDSVIKLRLQTVEKNVTGNQQMIEVATTTFVQVSKKNKIYLWLHKPLL